MKVRRPESNAYAIIPTCPSKGEKLDSVFPGQMSIHFETNSPKYEGIPIGLRD
jgi:hypothetical protein